MISSEFEEIYYIADKKNIKLAQDLIDQDKKNRKHAAKELKVVNDKLKIANKRIFELNSKVEKTYDDRGTQTIVPTTDQNLETEFTFEKLTKLENKLYKYKMNSGITSNENSRLHMKIKQLEEDLVKRSTTKPISHSNTNHKLTPKYKPKIGNNDFEEYDDVLNDDSLENEKVDRDLDVNLICIIFRIWKMWIKVVLSL
jgi:hypothetical protein